MNTKIENTAKRSYKLPQIERIKLDNEISLAMESNPPSGPGELLGNIPEHLNNDPFKTNHG